MTTRAVITGFALGSLGIQFTAFSINNGPDFVQGPIAMLANPHIRFRWAHSIALMATQRAPGVAGAGGWQTPLFGIQLGHAADQLLHLNGKFQVSDS